MTSTRWCPGRRRSAGPSSEEAAGPGGNHRVLTEGEVVYGAFRWEGSIRRDLPGGEFMLEIGLDSGAGMLQKQFRFKTFLEGIAFVTRVAELAETMNHHPDIYIRFGLITISLVTHNARGITTLDFEQATRLEGLL